MRRLAIVGFGRLAQRYYVPALRSIRQVEISAVADPLPASRAAAEAAFPGVRTYCDYRDLLEHERIDAMAVASPPSTHLPIWNDAARRDVPTLMEKPFVLSGELEQVERSPSARGRLMPDFNRRFWPAFQAMRELCVSGRLGDLESADFILRVNIEPWCSVTRHRLSPNEGGAIHDLGSSQLDLIQYVLGEKIVSLRARTSSIRWPDDHVRITALLKGGFRVGCELGYAKRNCESVTIVGSRASVRLDNPNARVHVHTRGSRANAVADWLGGALALGYRAVRRQRSMLRYTVHASFAEFFDALYSRRPFSPNFEDAIENAVCLEAAMRSVTEGRFVEVNATESTGDVCQEQA